jgi:hypothetical protein
MAFMVKIWIFAYRVKLNQDIYDDDPKEWSHHRHRQFEDLERWHFPVVLRFTQTILLTTAMVMVIGGLTSVIAYGYLWQLSILIMPALPILLFVGTTLFPISKEIPYNTSPFIHLPETTYHKRWPGVTEMDRRALLWLLQSTSNQSTFRAAIRWVRPTDPPYEKAFLDAFLKLLQTCAKNRPLWLASMAAPLIELFDVSMMDDERMKIVNILIKILKTPEGAAHVLSATLNRIKLLTSVNIKPHVRFFPAAHCPYS